MKHLATMTLMLTLGVVSVYAEQVKLTFSGTVQPSSISLQAGTNDDQVDLAGSGAQGAFTYRELHADNAAPPAVPPSNCSGPTHLFFQTVAGGGVFRFQDGSLLTVTITAGSVCIDFVAGTAHVSETYKITGGTGRYKNATGNLTASATWTPVLFNGPNSAVLLTTTGDLTGTVSGVTGGGEREDRN